MGELGKVYRRKTTNGIDVATVVEENAKFKTCIIQLESGKTMSVTTKTLHDVWECIGEQNS